MRAYNYGGGIEGPPEESCKETGTIAIIVNTSCMQVQLFLVTVEPEIMVETSADKYWPSQQFDRAEQEAWPVDTEKINLHLDLHDRGSQ